MREKFIYNAIFFLSNVKTILQLLIIYSQTEYHLH